MMEFTSLYVLMVVIFSLSMFIGLTYTASGQSPPCTNWKGLPDNDCDSLADIWETTGYDVDMDGTPDLDLKALGANPNHKDIFVELDYMQYHKPRTGVIPAIVTAFANAPIPNPDGLQGIKLHIIENE